MTYNKESIYDTGLPIKVIDDSKRFGKYPQIGFGEEGSIHKYDNKYAFKVFEFFEEREKLTRKFKKIEAMAGLKDKAFCFPIGLVGYLDLKKEGYYMDLVNPDTECKDFSKLDRLKDMKKVLEYLIMADKAIERIHKKGIIIGDIKDENILIDKSGNIKFVDTDNYKYLDYDYDLIPSRSKWLKYLYNKDITDIDNEKFVYTILALDSLVKGISVKRNRNVNFLNKLIDYLDVSNEIKDGFRILLSDAPNKPYVSKVLKKIDPTDEIISKNNIKRLERI